MNNNTSQLIENAGDGIVSISENRTITLWNQSAERIFGYTKPEAIGRNIDIVMPHDNGNDKHLLFDKVISGGVLIQDLEAESVRKDGEKVVIVGTISPVKDDADNVTGASWIFRILPDEDVTKKDLAHFEKLISLGKLAAEIAHRIKSPLGAVSGRIQLLLRNPDEFDNKKLRRNLKQMLESCKHVEIAIGRLLKFSRKPKHVKYPVNINTVIDDALTMTEHRLSLKLIKVCKTYTENLPGVMGIYEELIHAFVNIITNAVDAMSDGGRLDVTTDISINTSEKLSESKIRISISDNGHGISKEDIKRVFDPFFTTKEEGKGTGLGLFIVNKVVDMHNGSIDVLSKLNHGTGIIILFPCLADDGRQV